MNINLSYWVSASKAQAADGKYTGEVYRIIYGRAQARVGKAPIWDVSLDKEYRK